MEEEYRTSKLSVNFFKYLFILILYIKRVFVIFINTYASTYEYCTKDGYKYRKSNIMNVTIYPVRIDNDGIPHLEERWNNGIINKVTKTSEGFGTSINIHENIGQISVKHLE